VLFDGRHAGRIRFSAGSDVSRLGERPGRKDFAPAARRGRAARPRAARTFAHHDIDGSNLAINRSRIGPRGEAAARSLPDALQPAQVSPAAELLVQERPSPRRAPHRVGAAGEAGPPTLSSTRRGGDDDPATTARCDLRARTPSLKELARAGVAGTVLDSLSDVENRPGPPEP